MPLAFSFVLGSAAGRSHLRGRLSGGNLFNLALVLRFQLAGAATTSPLVQADLDGPAMSLLGTLFLGLALDGLTKLVVLFVPLGVLVNAAASRPKKMHAAVFDLMRSVLVIRMGHLACPSSLAR
jgi:hypothetical protein